MARVGAAVLPAVRQPDVQDADGSRAADPPDADEFQAADRAAAVARPAAARVGWGAPQAVAAARRVVQPAVAAAARLVVQPAEAVAAERPAWQPAAVRLSFSLLRFAPA